MKKIILIVCLLMSIKGFSQVFNLTLQVNPLNSSEIQVVLKSPGATPLIAGTYLNNYVLTVRWPTSCGMTLGSPMVGTPLGANTIAPQPQAPSGGFNYTIFTNPGDATPAITVTQTEYILITIPVSGGTPSACDFQIVPTYGPLDEGTLYMSGWAVTSANAPIGAGSVAMAGTITSSVLPVDLLTFKGIKKGKVSQLQWEATGEKNLVNYIVERSTDGRNFHAVGFTKPKSFNATEKVAYDFVDDQPEMGINYYRLLSKGFGKDEKYSKVISLDFGLGLSGRVYPNPLDGELSIDLDIESNAGTVDVGIYDVVGKQILSKKIESSDRRINMTLPTAELAPGIYIVKVKVGTFNWERQITKM